MSRLFKKGDKVVFINNKETYSRGLLFPRIDDDSYIKLNNIYTVRDIEYSYNDDQLININEKTCNYLAERFILLSEYRKLKLDKINEK